MKKWILRLAVCHVMATILIILTAAGITSGFFISSDQVRNTITNGKNETEIVESFGQYKRLESGRTYIKKVQVRNNGDVDCYVRVFAEVEDPQVRSRLSLNLNTSEWSKEDDGYYYCNKRLKKDDVTPPVLNSIVPLEDLDEFRMICYSESVQAEGFDSATEAFAGISGGRPDEKN